MAKVKGTVKWFNPDKGFGFLSTEEGGKDVFVNFHSIEVKGHKRLVKGQQVSFEIEEDQKGLHAINVQLSGPHGSGGGLDD